MEQFKSFDHQDERRDKVLDMPDFEGALNSDIRKKSINSQKSPHLSSSGKKSNAPLENAQ